ncbi:hypothetical protein AVEN_43312-1, partial [Araneus ventricosus]
EHDVYLHTNLVILSSAQVTRTTTGPAPILQDTTSHHREGVWLPTQDLGPHSRGIFSEIEYRKWNPAEEDRDLTTRTQRPVINI